MSITIEKVKQLHPEVFNSIFKAGVKAGISSEKSRVESWLNHSGEDVQTLKRGIESGNFYKQ